MQKIEINEISSSDWDKILPELSGSNFFQQTKWLELVVKEFSLSNRYFKIAFSGKNAFICLQCKNNEAYSNFIGYGGPISKNKINACDVEIILKTIENNFGLEMKRVKLFPGQEDAFKDNCWLSEKTSILEIKDWEKKISKNARNSSNSASKNMIDVRMIKKEELGQFYDIYEKTMDRVKSSYKTPMSLFENLFSFKNVYFVGAFNTDSIISASIFLNQGDWSYYWWNASSELGRIENANYLIMFSTIKKLSENGFKFLDMASSNNDKILNFKRKWGAKDVEFFIFAK